MTHDFEFFYPWSWLLLVTAMAIRRLDLSSGPGTHLKPFVLAVRGGQLHLVAIHQMFLCMSHSDDKFFKYLSRLQCWAY